jgi:uncharacterized protein YgfB (UPF0149 family)
VKENQNNSYARLQTEQAQHQLAQQVNAGYAQANQLAAAAEGQVQAVLNQELADLANIFPDLQTPDDIERHRQRTDAISRLSWLVVVGHQRPPQEWRRVSIL